LDLQREIVGNLFWNISLQTPFIVKNNNYKICKRIVQRAYRIQEDENSNTSRKRVVESSDWIIAIMYMRVEDYTFSTTIPRKNNLWKLNLIWLLIHIWQLKLCLVFRGCNAMGDLLFTNTSDWRSAVVEWKHKGCDWPTAVDFSKF
jgi:hypothetical protein